MQTILETINENQPQLVHQFELAIEHDELAHAYLLVGPSGVGKTQLAQWVAMRLFCLHVKDGQPDGTCEECHRISAQLHPDVLLIEPDGRQIKVDQVRYLKAEFSKSAVEGSKKIFIIRDADKMTVSAANSLLKFLEEPSGDFVAFLLTTNKSAILPTIQSRTQVVDLPPLNGDAFTALLQQQGIPAQVQVLAANLTSSVIDVNELMQDDWLIDAKTAIEQWYQAVSQADMRAFVLVQTDIMKLANNREHQQMLLTMIMLIWRDTMFVANQTKATIKISYQAVLPAINQAIERYGNRKITMVAQLTLATRKLLDQNISFQNIVEQLTIQIVNQLKEGRVS